MKPDKRARVYPLEIENAGEDTYILMSKGHHDPHEFMLKVRAEGYDWPLGMPTHHWVKAVPTRLDDFNCLYVLVDEGVKGAFPATFAHEAYGDDAYKSIVAKACPQAEQEPVAQWCGYCHSLGCVCPKLSMPTANAAPQPVKQEPVGFFLPPTQEREWWEQSGCDDHPDAEPLYAAPVQQVDLTDDEIGVLIQQKNNDPLRTTSWEFARAVIAAYKEKNRG